MSKTLLQIAFRASIVFYAVTHGNALQAQIDHATIKKIALEVLAADGPDVRPSAQIRERKVFFVLPRPKSITRWYGDQFNEQQEDPFLFPLDEQLKVEIMRKYPPNALSRRVFRPYLDDIEKSIGQIIQEITSSGSSKQLRRTNKQLDRLAFQIVDMYWQGISEYARRRRRAIAPKPMSIPYYKVAFTSRPDGARIWLCPILEYRLAEFQRKKVPWRLAPDPKDMKLAGQFVYLLQWGDKSQVGKKAINIGRSGIYLLK